MITKLLRYIFSPYGDTEAPIVEPPPVALLPSHDPMDWRITDTSKPWEYDRAFCPQCLTSISGSERLNKVCYNCGYKAKWMSDFPPRSCRHIWNGNKWVWQYKWGNHENEYLVSENKLHSNKHGY